MWSKLGQLKAQSEFYKNIISVITSHGIPTLIDADALPEVFSELSMRKYEGNQFVLTPHPKEFLQMIGKDTVSDDIKEVMSACKKVSQVIVYKTNRTLCVIHQQCGYRLQGIPHWQRQALGMYYPG